MKRKQDSSKTGNGFSRRDFVKVSAMGMLTVGMLSCGSDNDDDDIIDGGGDPAPAPSNAVATNAAFFPQSVATGDPRPDSVIFWTRVFDSSQPDADLSVDLVIGTDAELRDVLMTESFVAAAAYDGTLKVQVNQLDPYTTYYYQFQYNGAGSVVGRTKTAPLPDADVAVKFAFVSCQDFRQRYYNTLVRLTAMDDVDFLIHLGDYIYETANKEDGERAVVFSNPEEAIDLGSSYSARSIGNYRDLYKTYRSDPILQRVHEMMPMIAIWDDHEFANDSHKATATDTGGIANDTDFERKKNAERVHAEYMPTSFGLNAMGELAVGDETLFPNTSIYRDFRFGQHMHLLMTDYRTFRPDHLIPEDAYPGTVAVDEATLRAVFAAQGIPFEAVASIFDPYVNLDAAELAPYKQIVTGVTAQQYLGEGLSQSDATARAVSVATGNFSINVLNQLVAVFNQFNPASQAPPLNPEGQPVGLPYFLFGKTGAFSGAGLGSRYFIVKDTYDLFAGVRYQLTGGASEDVFGLEQNTWLNQTLANSDATWRVMGNSCSFTSLIIDLRGIGELVPPELRQQFYVNVDQWDGFPNKKQEVLQTLANTGSGSAILLAGDIHASHVAKHADRIFEFTVAGVSSSPFKGFLRDAISGPPFDTVPAAAGLVESLETLNLQASPEIGNGEKQLRYTNSDVVGFAVVTVDGQRVETRYFHLEGNEVLVNQYETGELSSKTQEVAFQVNGSDLTQIFP